MLYVFLVDTGTMLTFDMNLAMESVTRLKGEICKMCHIQEDKQVLLISGGENLDPSNRVCSYSAGTDTNPIFLFSKSTIESANPPSPSTYYGSERDLKETVDGSINMRPSYETIVARAQLALQFHDIAKEEMRVCENLVHDQHLQHQGWAAVIANLEDISVAFRSRSELFQKQYDEYLERRETYKDMLHNFGDAIVLLDKTPLLSCLCGSQSPRQSVDGSQSLRQSVDSSVTSENKPHTLLEWISLQDSRGSLQQMAEHASKEVDQLDRRICDTLLAEMNQVGKEVGNASMKEVKGLEERLYSLEQLMYGARRLVQEQADMAQGFVQNQNRAGNLRDPSVLPDLCASHQKQLPVMLRNHQQLRDIRKKCTKAKEELSINLHTRLRWVMYVEKAICDADGKLVIHHENLKRLKRKIEILKQMHDAPRFYISAIVEIVRRREFSKQFCKWAQNLAGNASHVHDVECIRRKEFLDNFGRHFLFSLFSGLSDIPPPFATEAPGPFDKKLPEITEQDVDNLKQRLPELAECFRSLPIDYEMPAKNCEIKETIIAHVQPTVVAQETQTSQGNVKNLIASPDDEEFYSVRDSEKHMSSKVTIQKSNLDEADNKNLDKTIVPDDDDEMVVIQQEGSIEILPLDISDGQTVTSAIDVKKLVDIGATNTVPQGQGHDGKDRERASSLIELESNEFLTADFYIEDSLPSSLCESPKQLIEKISELQKAFQEKAIAAAQTETELMSSKEKLHRAREKFKQLGEIIERDALKLKCNVLSIEKDYQKGKDDFVVFIEDVTARLTSILAAYMQSHDENYEKKYTDLKIDYDNIITEYKEKLEISNRMLLDAQNEVEEYRNELKNAEEKYETFRVKMECDMKVLKIDILEDKQATLSKLTLEHEVELDKIRSDFLCDIDLKDQEINHLKSKFQQSTSSMEKMLTGHKKEMKDLTEKFAKEKESLMNVLKDEFTSKVMMEKDKLESNHAEKVEKVNKEHENEMFCVKEYLKKAHQEEMDKLAADLEEKNQQTTQELLENFAVEKQNEVAELTQKLEVEIKERYDSQKPVLDSSGSQTSMVHVAHIEMQTSAVNTQVGVSQTSVLETFSNDTQTLLTETVSDESQTDIFSTKQCAMQTSGFLSQMKTSESQTDLKTETNQTQTVSVVNVTSTMQTSNIQLTTIESQTELKTDTSQTQTDDKLQDAASVVPSQGDEGSSLEMKVALIQAMAEDSETQTSLKEQTSLDTKSGGFHVDLEDYIDLEKHGQIIAQLKEVYAEEREKSVNEALDELRKKHEEEISHLIDKLHQEKHDSLTMLKSSMTADQQVAFNSAVDKIVLNKDKIIEEWKRKEEKLVSELEREKETVRNILGEKIDLDQEKDRTLMLSQEREREEREKKKHLEEELDVTQGQQHQLEHQAYRAETSIEPASLSSKIEDLQMTLKAKEEEVKQLQERMMAVSLSGSVKGIEQHDKVSIKTCNIGDTVLLCLDERHDQYVVFTVGATLHFLHADCLEVLGLKTAPGETRKSWVLAEITDKEYCQAKKNNNRFKVPQGTKFYRVKAKPWDKGTDPKGATGGHNK